MPDTDSAQFPRIYRAIMKRAWYDAASQRVISAAFVLRGQDTGLSVLKAVGCSPQDCLAGLNRCFGEFVLETDRVVGLGLRIVDDEPDAADFSDNHSEIIGIPAGRATTEEVKIAEDFASRYQSCQLSTTTDTTATSEEAPQPRPNLKNIQRARFLMSQGNECTA